VVSPSGIVVYHPSVIKFGISLVLSRYRDLINHYSGPTGEGRILI
jgi:hypothetical protein